MGILSYRCRIDELYRFLNSWVPELYGELDEDALIARGYELIQNDTEWIKKSGGIKVSNNCEYIQGKYVYSFSLYIFFFIQQDGRSNSDGEITEYTRESWEVSWC